MIAGLSRIVRDVGLAEELAQEAIVAALESWPDRGIPENPGAWLMATAKHRAIDRIRRDQRLAEKYAELGYEIQLRSQLNQPGPDVWEDPEIGDDLLRLIFTTCHPVLERQARVALTLRMLGGLTTDEIARAFLVAKPTLAQRIVRAKRTLTDAGVPFEQPAPEDLPQRLGSVLEVVYLIFNEGYAATAGEGWTRADLCEEAMRLGRMLAQLSQGEAEVHGLLALMEIQASRLPARQGAEGEPILLGDQDRLRWDRRLIKRGLAALVTAESLGQPAGPYRIQAELAACHARAPSTEETDWARIVDLYGELRAILPSPVVELNRAVAVAMLDGPEAGLKILDEVAGAAELKRYHLLPAVRGDLLQRLGRSAEASREFTAAAELTGNEAERKLLLDRAAGTGRSSRRHVGRTNLK